MSSFIDNVGLLCLTIHGGEKNTIKGRTKLQKMIYFSRYLGWDVGEYSLHYYGPFSSEMADNLQTSITNKLISEKDEIPYTYRLTDEGNKFLQKFESKVCDPKKVNRTKQLVSYLSNWTKDELELAATTDYIYRSNPEITKKSLLDKVKIVKDGHSNDAIIKAYDKWLDLRKIIK